MRDHFYAVHSCEICLLLNISFPLRAKKFAIFFFITYFNTVCGPAAAGLSLLFGSKLFSVSTPLFSISIKLSFSPRRMQYFLPSLNFFWQSNQHLINAVPLLKLCPFHQYSKNYPHLWFSKKKKKREEAKIWRRRIIRKLLWPRWENQFKSSVLPLGWFADQHSQCVESIPVRSTSLMSLLSFCRNTGIRHWWGSWLRDRWTRKRRQRCLFSGRNGGLLWCQMASSLTPRFPMNWSQERFFCRAWPKMDCHCWLYKLESIFLLRIISSLRVINHLISILLSFSLQFIHSFVL